MLGVEHERRIDTRELRRLVRLEDVAVERTLEQVVVDAEQHVSLRVARGQERARYDLAGVARFQDLQSETALLLERLLHRGGDLERVVRDEHDLGRLVVASTAAARGARR